MPERPSVSLKFYNRLNGYLYYMKQLPSGGPKNISSSIIADALGVNVVQVRKDLGAVSDGGKPKVGYVREDIIADIEDFLMSGARSDTAIVGVGSLGKALLCYENFQNYGLNISVAFDNNPNLIGTEINGVKVFAPGEIEKLCRLENISIGIITVPAVSAQDVCDALVQSGVKAIWNFAPVKLRVPEKVIVKQEDMAASLAILNRRLTETVSGT